MQSRRGTTLIETLVVVSTASVVLVLAATTIASLLRNQTGDANALVASTRLSRLAIDFRRDAHQAMEAELISGSDARSSGVVFRQQETPPIRYEVRDGNVIRRQEVNGRTTIERYTIGQGSGRFDVFTLPSESSAAADHATFVRFVHARKLSPRPTPPMEYGGTREYRIDAHVSRDHRFLLPVTNRGSQS